MYREGDVQQALLKLGIETEQRNNELLGLCPMHLERTGRLDSHPSWSMNSDTGVHHCFSCGYRGTLLTLVAEINEFITTWDRLDLDAAKAWLRSNVEVDFQLLAKQLEEAKDTYVPVQRPIEMSEARLAVFTEPPLWALEARQLTLDACNKHGVLWDGKNWITPIRNPENNKLMGWQEKGQGHRHFRNRPTGVQKSKTLFGLDVWAGGTMIIVESPLDVVRLSSLGIDGGVSTYGAFVSEDQLALMRKADKLIFAFDNPRIDPAGLEAMKDMLKRTRLQGMECWFVKYTDDVYKDIGDMPENAVDLLISNATHCIMGERAFI